MKEHVVKVPTDLKLVSAKNVLIDRLKITEYPIKTTSNTAKEETVLEYVEDFRRQFVQVFPDRRPLLLFPKNEAGVRKFVCSTVRPTKLPYNSIYDLDKCANFVADSLKYLPLDQPTQLPDILPSPSMTLKLQAGDCVDFSNLLCSLLIGVGYNAYVVSGYAPKWITEQDLSNVECPLLEETGNEADVLKPPAEDSDDEIDVGDDDDEEEKKEEGEGGDAENAEEVAAEAVEEAVSTAPRERYATKKQPKHQSKFEKLIAREKQEKEAADALAAQQKALYVQDTIRDALHGSRVHCWVMVLKGRREIQEDLFIEPSTGKTWKVQESPYLGVESVWNQHNYWANVQEKPVSELSTDLSQESNWEYVLIDENKVVDKSKPDELAAQQFDVGGGEEAADKQLSPEEAFDDKDILDCPTSWCEPIKVSRVLFQEQFPGGYKIINYKRCTVEKYCEDFETMKGMVLRITLFQTADCVSPVELREIFTKRKDKLERRYTYPLDGRTHEYFGPGRPSGLREYIRIDDKYRYLTFYSSSRTDGLVRRDEYIKNKVVEEYENRDDYLIYRSVKVDSTARPRGNVAKNTLLVLAGCTEAPILKITEKYDRNSNVPAHEDVKKRTHFVEKKKISLNYHFGSRKITAEDLTLDKNDKNDTYTELEIGKKNKKGGGKPNENKELLSKLVQKEKELISKLTERESKIAEELDRLGKEAEDVQLERSVYDIVADTNADDDANKDASAGEDKERNKVDYLSPFLAQHKIGEKKGLTRAQAMQAKEECLAALKERLLERANIIQRHLDEENQQLHQRRALFRRQNGSGASAADEEFTKYYEQAAFRIDILKARLARHEELALKRYVEMDQKLNSDARLAVLRT